jgi:hypothetical protein
LGPDDFTVKWKESTYYLLNVRSWAVSTRRSYARPSFAIGMGILTLQYQQQDKKGGNIERDKEENGIESRRLVQR